MSSTLKIAILLASAALPLTAAPVPALAAPAHAHGHAKAAGTLVDIAVGSADHTTLVAAVKAAGL
ncbi:fasciclin domain-containing protein, partial [Vibrio parahaemolyticus]